MTIKFKRLGLEGIFSKGYGAYEDLKEMNGLSKTDIVMAVKELIGVKRNNGKAVKYYNPST
ncbi:MAG: hypothetical protein HZA72_03525 [Candidatus Omnitrophica bacterium]|nr:hypothetical protein [Candidatus Omnitrophota bacterium]